MLIGGELVARVCSKCKVLKSTEHFYRQPLGFGGRMSHCKPCNSQRCRLHKTTPESKRRTHLKTQFKITPEDYDRLLEKQHNQCAVCGVEGRTEIHPKLLAVDHDHKTGQIRGLLCNSCNVGIGMFKDSVDRIKAAVVYMRSR